ncbi:MAG: tripartite tricarboxylate transporter substrate binding protein [Betaproteobacteria bacterium]|nr:tripartite tricarboxylate transporter substrate binding protein [Betaproteobacteria bacterium]
MNKASAWLLAFAVGAWSAFAAAQGYPSKPIKLIVPYPPGGNTDIVARIFGAKLSERLGQPIVYDNRGGAAGRIGAAVAAKSPADGYTLVIGDLGTLVIASFADPNLQYSPTKDFAPISLVTSVSIVVTANPDFPVNTLPEFLARARANPGKLTYATGGAGGPGHLAFEMLRSMAKIDIVHVPYKGGAPAIVDTIGGRVDVLVDGSAFGQLKGGKLKALAVTGPRLPALPDVPGIGESVSGFNFTNWWGFLAPAGTPPEAVARLNDEFTQIAALPEIRERLSTLGLAAQSGTPQQLGDLIRTETEKVARIVREAGVKFE